MKNIEQVIKHFTEMNISGLNQALSDNSTYFKCTKEVFLKKLQEVFHQFKEEGDTKLIYYKGSCGSSGCGNYGTSGHCFIGNKSGIYFSFIFEDNNLIDNWCICYDFKVKPDTIKLKYKMPFSIDYKEEANYRNTFQQYPPFVELKNLEVDGVLPMDRIEWWLLKYKEQFESYSEEQDLIGMFGKPNDSSVFVNLFNDLDELSQIKRKSKLLEKEVKEYYKIKDSEQEKKAWVIKNENLAFGELYIFTIDYDLEHSEKPDPICLRILNSEAPGVFIESKWVENITKFFEIFDDLFWVQEIFPESKNFYDPTRNSEPIEEVIIDKYGREL